MVTEISEKERKQLISMIDLLIDKYNFGKFLFEMRTKDGFFNWQDCYVEEILNKYNGTIRFRAGATKAVIIFDELGYVIKFPFANSRCNYCNQEFLNYRTAADVGLEEYLAYCDILYSFTNGCASVTAYVMEEVDCNTYEVYSTIESKYPDIIDDYEGAVEPDSIDEDPILEFLCAEWGKDIYDRFQSLINMCNINDIHGGNIGWNGNNWVIIDYSGY